MPIDEVLKYIGLLGAFLYLASYFLLQAGYIGGNSKAYTYLNLSAASLVLVSLTTAFNAASVVIQVSWILISIFGMSRMYLLYRRIRFTDEEMEFVTEQLSELPLHLARKVLDIGLWIDGDRGAELTRQGEKNYNLIYLKEGRAEVLLNNTQIAICAPGSFIGEMTVMSGGPATATVRLISTARLLCIDAEALRALSQNEAGIASVIQNSFSRDMRLKLEATSRHVRTLNMVELGDHS
jgi:CRP-like cAMP-binding protein